MKLKVFSIQEMKVFGKIRNSKFFFVSISLLLLIFYFIVRIGSPSSFIWSVFKFKVNDESRFNSLISRWVIILLFISVIITLFHYSKNIKSFSKIKSRFIQVLEKAAPIFSFKTLFGIIILYLALLFYFAVKNYDLGYDEAWYLEYAKNFNLHFISFWTNNNQIQFIDTVSMLPMYLFSIFNFRLGLIEVWQFKLLSSILSIVSICIICYIIKKLYKFNVTVIFLLLLSIQPGFGFIASSFFG